MFAACNVAIFNELGVSDPGGSMVIHVFGAAFGLAVAAVIGDKAKAGRGNGESALGTTRTNGLFAMIGTIILWLYWPSFNAAQTAGAQQARVVINTCVHRRRAGRYCAWRAILCVDNARQGRLVTYGG